MEVHDLSDEDVVEKDVAYLVKNFRKFLKFKNNGKFSDKGKFQSSGREKRELKKKMEKNPNLHKASLVLNAMRMDTLRKNVQIIP